MAYDKEKILKEYTGEKLNRGKAIRHFCIDCCGGSSNEVDLCSSMDCTLWPFRYGKDPYSNRVMTDEQKEAARKRFSEIRKHQKEEKTA